MSIDAAGQSVGQKNHVEFCVFSLFCHATQQVEILAARFRIRVPPAGNMVACTLQKEAEMHLFLGHFFTPGIG